MIKKRINKRRNPSEEEDLRERRLTGYGRLKLYLSDIAEYGNPEDLVNAIILYKQGLTCYDCYNEELGEKPKSYYECVCEKCPHCGFRRDLCYLNIDYKGNIKEYYTEEEREKVKESGYELILEILADDFYNDGRKYTIIPDIEDKDLNKLKEEFLNNVLQKENIDLSYANLCKVDLSKTDLAGADLTKANLTGADLTGANLAEADLSEADLTGANLKGTFLSTANITGTNFTGTNYKPRK